MTLLDTFFPELYNTTPYNIIKKDDVNIVLELNVAGISEDNIDVEISGNVLMVSAKNALEKTYLYRGLYTKPFNYKFKLRDDIVVNAATVKNGILSIELQIQIPEDKKPRKILITH